MEIEKEEVFLGCEKGLFVISIDSDFIISQTQESYFKSKRVIAFYAVDDLIFVCVEHDYEIKIIQRNI